MAGALARRDVADRAPAGAVEALSRLLDDLAAVIVAVPGEAYVAHPMPGVSGAMGSHVRHTLEHIAAFAGATGGPLSYDCRERGTAVERDPASALRAIFRLKAALAACRDESLNDPIEVVAKISVTGDPIRAWSSRGRELAFVQSHTVHHQAMIALLLTIQGYGVPAGFGFAPSTPRA